MFKGYALMATLPQTPSNRLCHSPSPVGVKGDATRKHDAGDTFITGCGVGPGTQTENPLECVKRITTVDDNPFSATQVCCGVTARESRQLLFRGCGSRLTVSKKRNGG